jgi:hypothetical protein
LLLIFSLILIFEIKDLKNDDPHLKTVPQQIGVKNTKTLGFVLLVIFFGLGFLNSNFEFLDLLMNLLIAIIIGFFLFFCNEYRSKYYTDFWVESIPIVWWLMFLYTK